MDDFMKRMEDYGADVGDAMGRLLDDAELYQSCLTAFAEDAGFLALGKAIEEEDYQEAFHQAHTLKGVAGNLSLLPLVKPVSELVEALRGKDYSRLKLQYANILQEQERLRAVI